MLHDAVKYYNVTQVIDVGQGVSSKRSTKIKESIIITPIILHKISIHFGISPIVDKLVKNNLTIANIM